MRFWLNKLSVCAAACFLFTACSSSIGGGGAAPHFELKDLSGNVVRLDSFRGHPVLLDFWATWCGPCRISIPFVQEFYRRHREEGVVVLGLNMDEDPSDVYAFVKSFKMTYPVLFAGQAPVSSDYRVDGLPSFVFIDPKGNIDQRYQGFSFNMPRIWERDLKQLQDAQKP